MTLRISRSLSTASYAAGGASRAAWPSTSGRLCVLTDAADRQRQGRYSAPKLDVGVVCVRACVLTSLPLHQQAYTRCSGLARSRAPALLCLDMFLGAREWPRRLVFSRVCAGMVPVAPAVGAVLVCACCTGGTRCGLMCVWYLR